MKENFPVENNHPMLSLAWDKKRVFSFKKFRVFSVLNVKGEGSRTLNDGLWYSVEFKIL